MSDKEILNLCLNESTLEKGFKILVAAYSKKIYLHVRRMVVDHDDANDVVQNCFIKVWKALPHFREDSQLYTWIYRIASNESITFLNNKNKKNGHSFSGIEKYIENIKEDVWMDSEDVMNQLQIAIDSLPAKQKQVFIMRYYDEMKYDEMEQVLGTSAGALKASFHHAVRKVEEIMRAGLNLG